MKKILTLLFIIFSFSFSFGADLTTEKADGDIMTASEFNKLITTREGDLKPINDSGSFDTSGTYNIGTTTSPWNGIALSSGGTQEVLKIKYFSVTSPELYPGIYTSILDHGISTGKVRGVFGGIISTDYAVGGASETPIIFWADDYRIWMQNTGGSAILDAGHTIKGYVIYAE